jgi:hypothetical protein
MEAKEKFLTDFKNKKSQVSYLLEKYPMTRENDFFLQYMWLKVFGKIDLPYIKWEDIKASGTLETLSRARRKIQNEEGRFRASEGVREHRERKRILIQENLIRIPSEISNYLKIKKGDKFVFVIEIPPEGIYEELNLFFEIERR